MSNKGIIIAIMTGTLLLSACNQEQAGNDEYLKEFDGKLDHVHGLGYMGSDADLAFASHDGLKFYQDGEWYSTSQQNNDYMGFTSVDEGFYTSGHPGKDSNLPNPLGVQKSSDKGKTLEEVAFEGDFDFHVMGVGYNNHTMYVVNGHETNKLSMGIHKSTDNGEKWEKVEASGLQGEVMSLAVHPTNSERIAAASKVGIYLSEDGGSTFTRITKETNGTMVHFTNDFLYYGFFDSEAKLVKFNYQDNKKTQLTLPDLDQDAVAYFAQHPENAEEMVFLSFNNHAFQTKNGGDKWETIVEAGEVQE
ncbi:hypothetical protein GLW08_05100 [Pontibacillus yanchengensis]|uniref:Uncharacterized protein n=2 Tax=Pontibacillus yanchengensis TaxID=462910 RepID=A0ACC7VD47_9BACI|nr:hypothetical protein [Pontibacillus yanchengensis]MYL32132.1 hypothetical protein [Pontibacillus yanchengensis]MYL52712.1 hypothetical protein [Pontibacillus yanchengensis]